LVPPPAPVAAPLAPATLTATAVSLSQINLNWSDVAGETGFTIDRSADGVTWAQIAVTATGVTNYQDTGVTAGAYQYRVCAWNSGGKSPYTYASASTVLIQAGLIALPDVPTALTASTVSNNVIDLAWSDAAGETGFVIERSLNDSSWTQIADTATGVCSYQDSGLKPGLTYFYRVSASNAAGNSAPSIEAAATTLLVPPAPSGVTAKALSTSQIQLAWNSVPGVTGYKIDRSANGVIWSHIANTLAGVTSYLNGGLYAGRTYYYRVRACASGKASAPTAAQASATTVPPPPLGLAAMAASASQINLTWFDVIGETGFQIERSLDGVNWTIAGTTATHVTSFQDTGLLPATTYFYRVRASNAAGTSMADHVAWAITV